VEGPDRRIGTTWARYRGLALLVPRVAAELAADLETKARLLRSMIEGWNDREEGRWDYVLRTLDSAAEVLRNPVRLPDAARRRIDADELGPALRAAAGIDPRIARALDRAELARTRLLARAEPRRRKHARVRRRWKKLRGWK
jgi:hypothetical protein